MVAPGIPLRSIHLIRDPRDVVASIGSFDDKRGFYGFGRHEGEPEESYLRRLIASMNGR